MFGAVLGTIIFAIIAIVSCIGIGNYVTSQTTNNQLKTENRKYGSLIPSNFIVLLGLLV
jgi:hypothetical protein